MEFSKNQGSNKTWAMPWLLLAKHLFNLVWITIGAITSCSELHVVLPSRDDLPSL
jgi:hypothetical protein